VRVVLADDAVLFREGVARLLTEAGHAAVGQASDAGELLEMVGRLAPDVAIVDVRMPPTRTTEGLVAAARIRAEHPEVAVLVLAQDVEPHYALRVLADGSGRAGYLLKDRVTDVAELSDAVRRVAAGHPVVDPAVVALLVSRPAMRDPLAVLSPREREVLHLMAQGRSNTAIADRLYLTGKTVETHIRSIFAKLRLDGAPDEHRRVMAVLHYLRGPNAC
jgi:DNA-binding NarL/FixJ family response regulator